MNRLRISNICELLTSSHRVSITATFSHPRTTNQTDKDLSGRFAVKNIKTKRWQSYLVQFPYQVLGKGKDNVQCHPGGSSALLGRAKIPRNWMKRGRDFTGHLQKIKHRQFFKVNESIFASFLTKDLNKKGSKQQGSHQKLMINQDSCQNEDL